MIRAPRRRLAAAITVPLVGQALLYQLGVYLGWFRIEPVDCITEEPTKTEGVEYLSTYCDYGFFGPYFDLEITPIAATTAIRPAVTTNSISVEVHARFYGGAPT